VCVSVFWMRVKAVFSGVIVLLFSVRGPAAEPAVWRFEMGQPFSVKGKFVEGNDLSAAAGFTPAHALVGSDETSGVQAMSVDPVARVVTVGGVLPLLRSRGSEIDLEGIAAGEPEHVYYVVGSHSLSRRKVQFSPDRCTVFSLPVDSADRPQLGAMQKATLRPLVQADPVLKPFLDKPAGANGFDIEGVAAREGRLFFGLRGPSLNGQTFILEVVAKELFGGRPAAVRHAIALGPGRGIREIVALRSDGFLVLAGPSGEDDGPRRSGAEFSLWLWPGPAGAAKKLSDLPAMSGSPEAIFLFSQTEALVEGLIFFDGAKDGAPRSFRLVKSPG